jgi:hypothetical protein
MSKRLSAVGLPEGPSIRSRLFGLFPERTANSGYPIVALTYRYLDTIGIAVVPDEAYPPSIVGRALI